VRLLELMTAAERLRLRLYHASQGFQSTFNMANPRVFGSDDPLLRGMMEEFDNHHREINERLGRYRWRPFLHNYPHYMYLHTWYLSTRRSAEEKWENNAVRWLLQHHIKGSGRLPAPILRFRQCGQCSDWFYALTNFQAYCSTDCRQKNYRDSPEFRAKRATYMREKYRPEEKEREQRAIKQMERAKAKKA
jgi:hypothetical protein